MNSCVLQLFSYLYKIITWRRSGRTSEKLVGELVGIGTAERAEESPLESRGKERLKMVKLNKGFWLLPLRKLRNILTLRNCLLQCCCLLIVSRRRSLLYWHCCCRYWCSWCVHCLRWLLSTLLGDQSLQVQALNLLPKLTKKILKNISTLLICVVCACF